MQTLKKPIKFRWILAIALILWAFTVGCYLSGLTEPGMLTLPHTLLIPVLAIVSLTPLSVARAVRHKWFEPGIATWIGLTIPGVYLTGSWMTGIGHRCDRVAIVGGAAAFVAINLLWAIEVFQRRMRLGREIGITSPPGSFQPSTASGA